MATRGNNLLTFADLHTRLNPDGTIARVIEMLSQRNTIIADIPWVECNGEGGHTVTQRTKLGSSTLRVLNRGIDPSKGETTQIKEIYCTDEDRSHIDIDQPPAGCNIKEYLAGESMPHMSQMANKAEGFFFYGDPADDPSEMTGFIPRFNSLSTGSDNPQRRNIIDAGGTGSDNASIILTVWGDKTTHGIYPKANGMRKGAKYGLIHEHLGIQDVEDTDMRKYRAYIDWFQWKYGLAIEDWRYTVRICNIDVSNLRTNSNAADLNELIIQGMEHLEDLNMGNARMYMNRTVSKYLRLQSRRDVRTGGGLTFDNIGGRRVAHFDGLITRISDGLLNTESAVTA